MCLGCEISRGPGQDEVPCVVDEVLIVRPTIIDVMEIDVLVVRPYANRVKACRISLGRTEDAYELCCVLEDSYRSHSR
jgi:hypothetical protein